MNKTKECKYKRRTKTTRKRRNKREEPFCSSQYFFFAAFFNKQNKIKIEIEKFAFVYFSSIDFVYSCLSYSNE